MPARVVDELDRVVGDHRSADAIFEFHLEAVRAAQDESVVAQRVGQDRPVAHLPSANSLRWQDEPDKAIKNSVSSKDDQALRGWPTYSSVALCGGGH